MSDEERQGRLVIHAHYIDLSEPILGPCDHTWRWLHKRLPDGREVYLGYDVTPPPNPWAAVSTWEWA